MAYDSDYGYETRLTYPGKGRRYFSGLADRETAEREARSLRKKQKMQHFMTLAGMAVGGSFGGPAGALLGGGVGSRLGSMINW